MTRSSILEVCVVGFEAWFLPVSIDKKTTEISHAALCVRLPPTKGQRTVIRQGNYGCFTAGFANLRQMRLPRPVYHSRKHAIRTVLNES